MLDVLHGSRSTRRWRLTERGTLLISVFLKCHHEQYPVLLAALVA